jgi:polyisoprenoid-binding protein YceI
VAGELTIYQIDPAESHVRFELDEVLRGSPTTVVGSTDQVSGEIAADLDDLSSAKAGLIQINARTLVTDNNFRNRALNNKILNTGDYEFITFEPTAVKGLPSSATVGEVLEFTIDGDLTIRDVTLPVTFAVSASPVSETQLAGSASTTVNWADFDLNIPSVQNVADVEEEVELYIDFVAKAS